MFRDNVDKEYKNDALLENTTFNWADITEDFFDAVSCEYNVQ